MRAYIQSLARYSESLPWPIYSGCSGTGRSISRDTWCPYGLHGSDYFSLGA